MERRRFSVVVEASHFHDNTFATTCNVSAASLCELVHAVNACLKHRQSDPQLFFWDDDFGEFLQAASLDDVGEHVRARCCPGARAVATGGQQQQLPPQQWPWRRLARVVRPFHDGIYAAQDGGERVWRAEEDLSLHAGELVVSVGPADHGAEGWELGYRLGEKGVPLASFPSNHTAPLAPAAAAAALREFGSGASDEPPFTQQSSEEAAAPEPAIPEAIPGLPSWVPSNGGLDLELMDAESPPPAAAAADTADGVGGTGGGGKRVTFAERDSFHEVYIYI